MTNPRNRDTRTLGAAVTQVAMVSALILPTGVSASQAAFYLAVKQRLEMREGGLGSPYERAITLRDMENRLTELGIHVPGSNVALPLGGLPDDGLGVRTVTASGQLTTTGIEQFANSIMKTRLFADLTRKFDDPLRFADMPQKVQQILLTEITALAAERGADIRRVDEKIQTATESLAYTVQEVTASIQNKAAAGVRQLTFASANLNRATAGLVTQVTARLDNFTGGASGTATVESKMTAIADRSTGLEAQYTLKVTAGGAMAGYGIAATSSSSGNATSAFIIQADKFAIVSSSYSGGLTNTPSAANIMFGVDGDGTYVQGNLKVTGRGFFDGAFTNGGFNSSAHFNQARSAIHGAAGFTNAAGGYGLVGDATAGATSNGIGGAASGGKGVYGYATGAGGIGVQAENTGGGVALAVAGTMTINNTTLVANLNAEKWNGIGVATVASGSSTPTLAANKPGINTSCTWLALTSSGSTFYLPIWT